MPSLVLAGDDFANWQRQMTQSDDFASWQRQMNQDFQTFKDERDREFTTFLKAHWREMRLLYGVVRDKTPKPRVAPKVKPKPQSRPKPTPQLPRVRPPVVPRPPKPSPARVILPKGTPIKAAFYGHQLPFRIDPAFEARLGYTINKQAISDYWAKLSRADYEPLLKQLKAQRRALQLNDWAYLLMLHQLAKQIHPNRHNEQTLLTWFILIKNGYRARIAYDEQRISLFMPTKQQLYAVSYFTFDGIRYYVLPLDGSRQQKLGQVSTYDSDYPGATKPLDMRVETAVVTRPNIGTKDLTFRYKRKSYRIKIKYDRQTVAFFRTYPQMDIGMYFLSTVHPETRKQLLEQFKPLVTGKSELDAVNLLLRFVQTAFEYKLDKDQFGEENYLFSEETLFYPYSDCEDRSVLFAWLVRNLLKLEVVGLDYPGHIATAVHFNGQVRGDTFIYQGKRYAVTDPTFINADAGMSMPQHQNTNPGIIPIL